MNPDNLTIYDVIRILRTLDNDHIQLLERYKNNEFWFEYDITASLAKDVIRNLSEEDFVKGPVVDDNPDREYPLWIFKKYVKGIRCYIKIKIINHAKVAIVVSFHEDES